jgi:hypothetical protein
VHAAQPREATVGIGEQHPVYRVLTLVWVAVAVHLAAGCSQVPVPEESDHTGPWCSAEGDLLTVDSDNTFTVDQVSEQYINDILHDPHYVEGYRLRTEYGGVVPTTAVRTWTLQTSIYEDFLDRRQHRIELQFTSFDDQQVSEWYMLIVRLDTWGDYVLVGRGRSLSDRTIFARCPSPAPSGARHT